MTACRICGSKDCRPLIDFSPQPICNRYLQNPIENEYAHPLALIVCGHCGVTQIEVPAPASEIRPRYDWITYNEPEQHLDAVADQIAKLPGITPDSVICGISYKDASTLRRLGERGFANVWVADLHEDLGVEGAGCGIETIQDRLDGESVTRMLARHPRPHVVIMRHVFEHSHDIRRMCETLKQLVAADGFIVLEMPDQQRALDRRDYSTVWEEHVFYFNPTTLKNALAALGFKLAFFESYPYTLEDSLVAIVQPSSSPVVVSETASWTVHEAISGEVARAEAFGREYEQTQSCYREFFARERALGKIAILGAGHLTCMLLNLLHLTEFVDFVADDDPNKKGLYMPGSRLPILGTEELVLQEVRLCCLGVRPEIEDKVIDDHREFTSRGGKIASFFPDSRYALPFLREEANDASKAA